MQASNAPIKSAVPFAESGTKNTIPVASQIGVTPGAASFTDGFPPLTMTPLAAGGVPPYGADFNGILNFLSAAARWQQAGGAYPYDSAFSTAVGGYPQGAMLRKSVGAGYWLNLVENNTANPDAGGANWIALPAGIASTAEAEVGTDDTRAMTPFKVFQAIARKVVQATESVIGVAKVATPAQTNAGADDATIVTPRKLRLGVAMSLGINGYLALPSWLGGVIIQWGRGSVNMGTATGSYYSGSASVSFPLAFPTAAWVAIPQIQNSPNVMDSISVASFTNSSLQVVGCTSYETGQAPEFYFIAIGN
ncbi:hypothetical protein IB258_26710 [Achromobacter sp. ACM02]|uniref:gp53-like domain-containing protein n=1 Tax=Achromobacter sp. ACM02 TaxID=2769305 RepID=UPI00177BA28B|nr:hypothetical protein [Achromobacter sp. ACM02]MBD9384860.1 hypothetical protein [Achromobacter sp. ACM02]